MNRQVNKTFTITFLFICSFFSLHAQDYQHWSSIITNYNFKPGWLAGMEMDYYRLVSGGPKWKEISIQPQLEHYLNNDFDLFTGLYFSYTNQTESQKSEELRPYLGARWNIIKPEKRVHLRTQLKYEFRYFKDINSSEITQSNRIRWRMDLGVPINRKSMNEDKNLYALFNVEYFMNFDDDVEERFWNTGRLYTGLGYRFSYNWRLELVYILQGSRDQTGENFNGNVSNISWLKVKYFIRKKVASAG